MSENKEKTQPQDKLQEPTESKREKTTHEKIVEWENQAIMENNRSGGKGYSFGL